MLDLGSPFYEVEAHTSRLYFSTEGAPAGLQSERGRFMYRVTDHGERRVRVWTRCTQDPSSTPPKETPQRLDVRETSVFPPRDCWRVKPGTWSPEKSKRWNSVAVVKHDERLISKVVQSFT